MRSGNKLLLGVGALLAIVALLAPSAVAAETCPKGQTGTPPYCTKVKFWLQTVKHEEPNAKIRVKVLAPGSVTASSPYIKTVTAKASSAGRFWMPLKLNKAGLALLQKLRTIKVKVKFAYTLAGGPTLTKRKSIRFRLHA